MTVNQEIKGNLAKLLATENLVVEHKKVSTASFDVQHRVLTLPIWNKASATVYDLLVGHEVGHALYTPDEDWREVANLPKDYVNVVEDVRVERLMKKKYPGLSKTFYRGYNELNDDDFFSIKGDNLQKYSLIDRINLHFKIGSFARIPFSPEESKFLDMIEKCETFHEVLNVCKLIFDFVQEQKKDQETIELNVQSSNQSGNSAESGEKEESNSNPSDSSSEGDLEEDSDSDEDDSGDGKSYGGTAGGGPIEDDNISKTQRSFDQESEKLSDNRWGSDTRYVEVPKVDLKQIIVDAKELHEYISEFWKQQEIDRGSKYWGQLYQEVDTQYKKYKNQSQKEVNYLVKEFECKKSADSYARASVSKTGVLDTSVLHTYKWSEDLFRKVSIVPDGKNHGLIFILDWSGSMDDCILDTVKQLLNLCWFCKKVQIPFEVYAFTYDWSNRLIDPDYEYTDKYVQKEGMMNIHHSFHLLNFLTSRTNNKEFEQQTLNVWRLASRWVRHNYYSYSTPAGLDLSGTPLNESVITLHEIIPQFKKNNQLQKVNVIILTDGESNGISFDLKVKRYDNMEYMGQNTVANHCALRDRKTGNVYRNFDNTYKSSITTILIENLKDSFPEVNVIGFRLLSGSEFSHFYRRAFYTDRNIENVMKKWRKEKSYQISGLGYDALYFLSSSNLSENSEFEVKENASNAEIGRAFRKMLKTKTTNKKILSSFATLVA